MDSLVSTQWLAEQLGAPDLRIVDASAHLPAAGRDARGDYDAGHIPGAVFLDLATLIDTASPVENTAPDAETFARRMAGLGIGERDRIVVYDDSAIRTAARAWFLLRMSGVGNVAILDGGLGKWKAEGRPLSTEAPAPAAATFTPAPAAGRLRTRDAMLANLSSRAEQVVDARGAPRFTGSEPEPRPGMAAGHIPGARNVPYAALYNPDGTLKDTDALRALFTDAGVDLARPVVTTCGSGMTACAVAFALDRIGKRDVALYDGSWAEWGADPATPKETGPGLAGRE